MANKQKLQGLLGTPPAIQKGVPFTVSTDAGGELPPAEAGAIQRGAAFTVSTADDANAPLPEAVLALRVELREIARSYIGARRRSGKALLEAARWLSEARAAAAHGEWYDFLAATETTADTAERLQRIYDRAMQHPAFAAAVADGRITQSAAERLARDSTPTEVIDVVLTAEKPPTVAEVDRAIRAARRPAAPTPLGAGGGQIPQIAGFGGQPPSEIPAMQLLREAAAVLSKLAASGKPIPQGEETDRLIEQIAQSLTTIRNALSRRG